MAVSGVVAQTIPERPPSAKRDYTASLDRLHEADLIGVMVADVRGPIREANDAFLELLGYGRDELLRGDIVSAGITPAEWRDADEVAARQLASQGISESWEKEYLRKDGTRVPVLVRAALLKGSKTEFVAFVVDDTKRRDAEEALRESEERLRLLLEHAGDAVLMLDGAGQVVTWSAAAARILGYSTEEALALHAADFYAPDERDSAQTNLEHALASGRAELEGWRVGKAGKRIWARVVTCPIHGAQRELRGFAQIIQDRTEIRATEDLLARRTHHLEQSNKELEIFASVASHDLQEPLRKLRTFSDRLKKRFAQSLDTDASSLVTRIDEAARRMQVLIDDLLMYSRLARRTRPFDAVDLAVVVREVLGDLSLSIEKSAAHVEVGELPTLPADPTRMRQLFQNLLANSLKFARPGFPPRISITSTRSDAGGWELRVQDNGIGFEQKYAERIFGLFQRLHGRSEYAGTGIGLAICQRIAEGHGGTVGADGNPGCGALFTVRLPAVPAPSGSQQ